ncbi:MAG: pyruvate carboxylase, partial [Bacteroidetes bacterium]
LEEKFEQIKHNYVVVNELFGDIVKVTPSSKVVGDMALYMTSNNLSREDVLTRGWELSFPDSVKSFFRGDLGQPYGGFPKELQEMVLKGEKPFTDRPNVHLPPVDFDREFHLFQQQFPDPRMSFLDFLSWKLYPRVFQGYYDHLMQYDEVSKIPTPAFFFPMKPNEEILVRIEPGKRLLIQYLYSLAPNDEGNRTVYFRINGQTRAVEIRDHSVAVSKQVNKKIAGGNTREVGCPLQGRLTRVLVRDGETIRKNQPLFVIEAMKMESTVTSPTEGKVEKVHLKEGVMVEQDDLVVEMA